MAVSKDVPIMTSDWILQVWEKSKHDAVHAADPQFSRFVKFVYSEKAKKFEKIFHIKYDVTELRQILSGRFF